MTSRSAILLAAWVALGLKMLCAALTLGTNDADTFYNFGRFIWEHGLLAQYRATPEFNHPPLTGWFCALAYGANHGIGFNFLLRLPGIVADFLSVRVLLELQEETGRPPTWALVLFALSPVNFMVSGFHGNVDSVLAWLLLRAAVAVRRGQPVACGGWLGLACQVKIIPLLVAPVFFFHWLARGRARVFFSAATVIILLGWSVPLLAVPRLFVGNVLGYNSNWGSWGISSWLTRTGLPQFAPVGFAGLTSTQLAVMLALKLIIVGSVLALAWRRRAQPPGTIFTTLALVWAVFFVFAAGVGAQYLVWLAPFFLLHSPRWFAVVTVASSAFLFTFYQAICGGLPWFHGVSTAELLPRWVAWSNLPWLALTVWLVAWLAAEIFPHGRGSGSDKIFPRR